MCRKYIITGTNKVRPKRKGNFDREVKVTFLFLKKGKNKDGICRGNSIS